MPDGDLYSMGNSPMNSSALNKHNQNKTSFQLAYMTLKVKNQDNR